MGRDVTASRGGELHRWPHHRARTAGLARQAEARRLHPRRQAEHSGRSDRGQGQYAQRGRRHAAGVGLRRDPEYPLRVLVERRRLRVPRPHGGQYAPRDEPPARRVSVTGRPVGAVSGLEGPDAGGRRDRPPGLLRGRRRKDTALLSDQRRQRGDRGHRQGAGPHPARHGHGYGQDVHRFPDHLRGSGRRGARSASYFSRTGTCSSTRR